MTHQDYLARQRLARFSALAQAYRHQWGLPLDKEMFLNLWAQSRNMGESPEGEVRWVFSIHQPLVRNPHNT